MPYLPTHGLRRGPCITLGGTQPIRGRTPFPPGGLTGLPRTLPVGFTAFYCYHHYAAACHRLVFVANAPLRFLPVDPHIPSYHSVLWMDAGGWTDATPPPTHSTPPNRCTVLVGRTHAALVGLFPFYAPPTIHSSFLPWRMPDNDFNHFGWFVPHAPLPPTSSTPTC